MILEVSQKQAFIFGSNKLSENLRRSEVIRYVTDPTFFERVCPDGFNARENLVYTGGGHTVLQFGSEDAAHRFAVAVSHAVLVEFPGVAMFMRTQRYDEHLTPGENLNALSAALEEKKARRQEAFHLQDLGMEALCSPAYQLPESFTETVAAPPGWNLTTDGNKLTGDDNFVAVVHLDGNAMGARVREIYNDSRNVKWEDCVAALRSFSAGIDKDFADAFTETAQQIADRLPDWGSNILPVRRVIGAGDDVCFLTAGSLGVEAAALFLQNLSKKANAQDKAPYAACAGVVLVHKKTPFRAAYDLSEALCSSAKRYGAQFDAQGRLCILDWHIELGELPDGLPQIRRRYRTRDGARLELRPLVVCASAEPKIPPPPEHNYGYFTALLAEFHNNTDALARSKIKLLRTALTQGEVETELAVRSMRLKALQERGVELLYNWKDTLAAKAAGWMRQKPQGACEPDRGFFFQECLPSGAKVRRCRYFDVIELMDHFTPLREEETE